VSYFIRLSDDDEYIQEAAFHHQVHKDIKTKKERKPTRQAPVTRTNSKGKKRKSKNTIHNKHQEKQKTEGIHIHLVEKCPSPQTIL